MFWFLVSEALNSGAVTLEVGRTKYTLSQIRNPARASIPDSYGTRYHLVAPFHRKEVPPEPAFLLLTAARIAVQGCTLW